MKNIVLFLSIFSQYKAQETLKVGFTVETLNMNGIWCRKEVEIMRTKNTEKVKVTRVLEFNIVWTTCKSVNWLNWWMESSSEHFHGNSDIVAIGMPCCSYGKDATEWKVDVPRQYRVNSFEPYHGWNLGLKHVSQDMAAIKLFCSNLTLVNIEYVRTS